MSALLEDATRATTAYAATIALSRAWRERPADHKPAHDANDHRYEEWAGLVQEVKEHFMGNKNGLLDQADINAIEEWVQGNDPDRIHAVAWGIDLVLWPTFTDAWRAELKLDDGRYHLEDRDFYPIADMDMSMLRGNTPTTRGASKGVWPNELPHVREHRPDRQEQPLQIVFDFNFEAELEGVIANLSCLAGIHPNLDTEELKIPDVALVFPVEPRDPEAQAGLLIEACDLAIRKGAQLLVIPELAVTRDIVDTLKAWLDDQWTEVLLIAGSFHTGKSATASNVAVGLLPDCDDQLMHVKYDPVRYEVSRRPPQKEGIAPRDRCVVVYVAGDFRLTLAICRDLLSDEAVPALIRAGVNVLAVPAMSSATVDFPARVRELVGGTQAFAVVANNPARWRGVPVVPAAVFGQPVRGRESVEWPRNRRFALGATGVTLLRVGNADAEFIRVQRPHVRESHPLRQVFGIVAARARQRFSRPSAG